MSGRPANSTVNPDVLCSVVLLNPAPASYSTLLLADTPLTTVLTQPCAWQQGCRCMLCY